MSRRNIVIVIALLVCLQVALAGPSKLSELKKRMKASLGIILNKKAGHAAKTEECKKIAAVVSELGEIGDLKAVKLIFSCFPNADTVEVFEAVKSAITPLQSKPDIRAYLVKQMTSKRTPWEIKAMLLELYREDPGADVFEALTKLMKDKSEKVARDALVALKDRGETRSVQPLIDYYRDLNDKDKEGLLWILVREALHAITGHDESDPENWQQWWDCVKEGFDPAKERGETGEPTSRTSSFEKKDPPKFFGTEIRSKRILFIIDCSGSMIAKDPPKHKDDAQANPAPAPAGPGGS